MKAKASNEHEDGLLEYLEDIIGTTRYKEPIEQASQEVETLNEERSEKMNRLRVVEREKSSLEVAFASFDDRCNADEVGEKAGGRRVFARFQRVDQEEVPSLAIPHVHLAE